MTIKFKKYICAFMAAILMLSAAGGCVVNATDTTINLAIGKSVIAVSHGTLTDAAKVIDGSTATSCVLAGDYNNVNSWGQPKYFTIDLGVASAITKVEIVRSYAGATAHIADSIFCLSNSPTTTPGTGERVATILGEATIDATNNTWSANVTPTTKYRYVQWYKTSGDTSIVEIRVYGNSTIPEVATINYTDGAFLDFKSTPYFDLTFNTDMNISKLTTSNITVVNNSNGSLIPVTLTNITTTGLRVNMTGLDYGQAYKLKLANLTNILGTSMATTYEKTFSTMSLVQPSIFQFVNSKDGTGTTVSTLTQNTDVGVKLTVKNNSDSVSNVTVVVGLYDANGLLLDSAFNSQVLASSAVVDLPCGITLPENVTGCSIRAYLMDSLSNPKLYSLPIGIPNQPALNQQQSGITTSSTFDAIPDGNNITISGTFSSAKSSDVMVVVANPDIIVGSLSPSRLKGKLRVLDNVRTNSFGKFSYIFTLSDSDSSGDYTAIAGVQQSDSVTKQFYFVSSISRAEALIILNNFNTGSDMKNYMTNSENTVMVKRFTALGLKIDDYNLLNNSDKLWVCSNFINEKNTNSSFTQAQVAQAFNSRTAIKLLEESSTANMGNVLTQYSSLFGLSIDNGSNYAAIVSSGNAFLVHNILAEKSFASISDILTEFNNAVALVQVNTASTPSAMETVLNDSFNKSLFEIDLISSDYTTLGRNFKDAIMTVLINKSFATPMEVKIAYDTKLADVKSTTKTINLAIGKRIVGTSHTSANDTSILIDGNTTETFYLNFYAESKWITIDLGVPCDIAKVEIVRGYAGTPDHIQNSFFYLSNDPNMASAEMVAHIPASASIDTTTDTWGAYVSPTKKYRYVRWNMTTGDTVLKEIRVLGTSVVPSVESISCADDELLNFVTTPYVTLNFNTDVDTSTLTNANITVKNEEDNSDVGMSITNVSTTGCTLSMPSLEFLKKYKITLANIKDFHGASVMSTAYTKTFKTIGRIATSAVTFNNSINGTGNSINLLSPSSTAGAKTTVYNYTSDNRSVTFMSALFDAEGNLVDTACDIGQVPTLGSRDMATGVSTPVNVEGYTLKTYLLDSLSFPISYMVVKSLPSSSQATLPPTVVGSSVNVEVIGLGNSVSVLGLLPEAKNSDISLLVFKPDVNVEIISAGNIKDKIRHIDFSGSANSAGEYKLTYNMKPSDLSGDYTAVVCSNSSTQAYTQTFYYANDTDRNSAIVQLNSFANSQTALDFIANLTNLTMVKTFSSIGLDITYYNKLTSYDKLRVFNNFVSNRNTGYDELTASTAFNKDVALCSLEEAVGNNILTVLARYNESVFNLPISGQNRYTALILNGHGAKITALLENKAFNTVAEVTTEFNKALTLTLLNTCVTPSNIGTQITDSLNNSILNLNLSGNYASLSGYDKTQVHAALMNKNYTNIQMVKTDFDNKVSELYNKVQTVGSQTAGNSGNGGSYSKIELPVVISPSTNSFNFSDLDSVPWAKDSVNIMSQKGIINGFEDGSFKPDEQVTREQFIKLIVSAFGLIDKDAVANFSDVKKDEWYYTYIASAMKNGVITGNDNGELGIGQGITRQDMAVIIYRVVKKLNLTITQNDNVQAFIDEGAIADYALDGVKALKTGGLITGTGDGEFNPTGLTTRAQAAVIINRVMSSKQY